MGPLVFREAERGDIAFIVGLIAADDVSATNMDLPLDPEAPDYTAAFAAIAADPRHELHIAEIDGTPVGTFQLSFVPGLARRGMLRGIIEGVHVAPASRRQGIGGRMIEYAIERCRAHGCGMVQLTSNKKRLDAHRFYRRLGFDMSHEGFKLFL
jgi:GNAT superfamily N-acetyltransferase